MPIDSLVKSYFPISSSDNKTTGLVDVIAGFSLGPLVGVYPVDPFTEVPGNFTHSDTSATGQDRYAVKLSTALGLPLAKTFYDDMFNLQSLKADVTPTVNGVIVGLLELNGTQPNGDGEMLWTWGYNAANEDAYQLFTSGAGGTFRIRVFNDQVMTGSDIITAAWPGLQRIAWVIDMTDAGDTLKIYTDAEGIANPVSSAMLGSYNGIPSAENTGMTFFGNGIDGAATIAPSSRWGNRESPARNAGSNDWGFIRATGSDVTETLYEGWISDFFANGGYPLLSPSAGGSLVSGMISSFIR